MIKNDGDIIRGLGFVTLYSAYLEEQVDQLLHALTQMEEFDQKKQKWPISKKIEHAKGIIARLNSELEATIEVLETCKKLFEKRNELVHGRIYSNLDRPETLRSGRPNVPERIVQPDELFELANELDEIRGEVYRPLIFKIPRNLRV